jgi:DNA modification methylase
MILFVCSVEHWVYFYLRHFQPKCFFIFNFFYYMKKLEWHTEKCRVCELIPNDQNPRVMSEKQVEDLKASIQKYNLVEIPIVDQDCKVLAGHQRLMVLKLLGRENETIEVRMPNRKLTKNEYDQYLLISNRLHGEWDWEKLAANFQIDTLLASSFDSGDLSNIFDDNSEIEDDHWDEDEEIKKINRTDIKLGDMFSLGRHRLICGDACDTKVIAKLMGEIRADMINDDLPFNIGLSYNSGVGGHGNYGGKTNDNKTDDEYRIFVRTIMQNALAVSKPDCHAFFWTDERYVWLFQGLYKDLGIDSKRLCIWIKDNASPTPNNAFNKVTEFCVYGTRGRPYLSDKIKNLNELINKELTTGNRLPEEIMDMLNIWLVKRLPGIEYLHPTQKSPTLHEKALRRCTRPGDVILDLTAGSGSIMAACEQLKRTAYMCEIEPIFTQLIINRYEILSGQKVKKLN